MPKHVPFRWGGNDGGRFIGPVTSEWILLPTGIDEEYIKQIIYEAIPEGFAEGRFEVTIAPPGDVEAVNRGESKSSVHGFPWQGRSISCSGNVTNETQACSEPITAFRVVVISGTMVFNVRAQ